MEQILIRNLPEGTKAALRARAEQNHRSTEAEARAILTDVIQSAPLTIVELLGMTEGADIDLDTPRLELSARTPEL